MDQPIKISVYTTVYNTKPYVAQCVESVLNQTYTNFEYIILDNGCTDGSSEILEEYANQDERIKLIRREENYYGFIANIILTCGEGDYLTILDSDDWLEPQFLERLVSLAVKNGLDIACAGSYTYFESPGEERRYQKNPSRPMVIRPEEYQSTFLRCLSYLDALWGKIIRTDIVRQALAEPHPYVTWAIDTVMCLHMLRLSNGVGIDNRYLHHYRIRAGSVAASYQPTRFDGVIYFYEYLSDFLNGFGQIHPRNADFLDDMYMSNIETALRLAASLPLFERLAEYRRMLEYPLTQEVLQRQREKGSAVSTVEIVRGMLQILRSPNLSQDEVLQAYPQIQDLLKTVAPHSYAAVTMESMPLFLEERSYIRAKLGDQKLYQLYMEHHRTYLLLFGSRSPLRLFPGNSVPLLQHLADDNRDAVLRKLKKLARKKGYAERYALPEAIRMLEQS